VCSTECATQGPSSQTQKISRNTVELALCSGNSQQKEIIERSNLSIVSSSGRSNSHPCHRTHKERTTDKVVGQILHHIGYVRDELAGPEQT